MLDNFWSNPFFWIGIYSIGYAGVMVALSLSRAITVVERKVPKLLVRVFILLTFIAPPVVLPFTKGSNLAIPTPVALAVGGTLLAINFIIKILGQRQIGVIPALKGKAMLVTTGIYGFVRHPLYMSNVPLAMGMAILFKSMFALLFSIPYSLLFLPIIYFEEKDLLKKYGEEYKNYKKKVPWRMIPGIF